MMKKLFAILLCVWMVLSLAACGNEETVDYYKADLENPGEENSLNGSWTEYGSVGEINAEMGCFLCPLAGNSLCNEHSAICDMGEYKVAEYRFDYGGISFCFRFSPVTTADISGINDEAVQKAFAEPCSGEIETVVTDTLMLARWATRDGQYSLMAADSSEDPTFFKMEVEELSQMTIVNMGDDNSENG